MFSSLRSRLWLTYFALIAVILGVVGISLFVYLLRNPVIYRQAVQHLKVSVTAITLRLDALEPFQAERLQRVIQREDNLLKVRVVILNQDGSLLADSRLGTSPALNRLPTPLEPQADSLNQPISIRDASGAVWLYRLGQLDDQHFVLAAVLRPRVAFLTVLRDEFTLLVVRIGGLAFLLAVILGILMSRWISAPLQHIARAARQAASGQYQAIRPEGPSEVRDLAIAFNEMTQRVQASQQSQRDLVANVSHELKTPLTSIQGFAQAILDGAASTPEALQQAAGVISDEAGRMDRMVLDLLTLARLDAGTAILQRTPLDLAALLGRIADRMSLQAKQAQVELQVEIQPLPELTGDEDRLIQVFTNLLDNAIKYTPPGGKVSLLAAHKGNEVEVRVIDFGPGIPADVRERIFERFYQADKARRGGGGRGVGLGLAIARELVQAQGGTIQVLSNPGEGSSFVVKIPVVKPEDTVNVTARKPTSAIK
ncbi:MAG: HAMP domain-containing sensor histidine kinase [Anaerolineaceae bacterium]|nr:HAMP domain-containing sensor histidine kinase [Anaerolineaceae bacterium]